MHNTKHRMKNIYLLMLLIGITTACTNSIKREELMAERQVIPHIAKPIQLKKDSTVLVLSDYFADPTQVHNSFSGLGTKAVVKGNKLTIYGNIAPPLSVLNVHHDSRVVDILMKKAIQKEIVITYKPDTVKVKSLAVIGDMNNWNEEQSAMQPDSNGLWKISFLLEAGKYAYQLLLNGNKILDAQNPNTIKNYDGSLCSYIAIENHRDEALRIWPDSIFEDIISVQSTDSLIEYIVFWQNRSLAYESRGNGIQIKIPDVAIFEEKSILRVYGYKGQALSNELLIPLRYKDIDL
jgi:hypothetical protein